MRELFDKIAHAAWLRWGIKLGLTAAFVGVLLAKIPAHDIAHALASVDVAYMVPALVLQLAMRVLNALQLGVFLRHQEIDFASTTLVHINLVTQFYGLVLPGEISASVVKWHKLSRRNKLRAQTMACILVSRVVNLLSLALLGTCAFFVETPYESRVIAVALGVGMLVSIAASAAVVNARISSVFERAVEGLGLWRLVPGFLRSKTRKLWDALVKFHAMPARALLGVVALAALYQLAGVVTVKLLFLAGGLDVPTVSIVWIRAFVLFAQLLPISIAGFGVREGAFVVLLARYGVGSADAIAVSLLTFSMVLFIGLLGGILELREVFSRADQAGV